jgi:hypothetical protein
MQTRTSKALDTFRRLVDTKNGSEWEVKDLGVGDNTRIYRQLKSLLETGEVVFVRLKRNIMQLDGKRTKRLRDSKVFKAVKCNLYQHKESKAKEAEQEWVYRDWFPIPEFKVLSLHRNEL